MRVMVFVKATVIPPAAAEIHDGVGEKLANR